MTTKGKKRLDLRNAEPGDVAAILRLIRRVYPDMPNYAPAMVRGQINNFPQGVFVALYDNRVVGYCATMRVTKDMAFNPHDWEEITANGFGTRHTPAGEWLYGYELAVDPKLRGLRIGQRIYDARKALAEELDLHGIVIAGRIPGFARARRKVDGPEDYIAKVSGGKLSDQVLSFQLKNGFEPIGALKGYLPEDKASAGYAAHLVWHNPYVNPDEAPEMRVPRGVESVRLAACQLQARPVQSFDEFIQNIEYFVDVAADYRCDFILFPELFTLPLLSSEKSRLKPAEAIDRLTAYTPRVTKELSRMALEYNINIIGGSHPTRTDDGEIQNVAYVALRDGSIHAQEKIHPTPNEAFWWNIKGGDSLDVIQTDCGPIGVLICYDSEFPELARRLVDQGARMIFVPFCTDTRTGYMRVRYCSQARAIENQCFMVLAGNVGNLPNVENMDIQYAQSCILTPCDLPFARDGIAAEASENVETLTMSDVNLADLSWARAEGTVRNLRDRRFDLYHIEWDAQAEGRPHLPPGGATPAGGHNAPGGG
ncbi:MAG: bifunctional GNAT family N-acetyltransferase/carbon-nitrogen hydrolase family protein [Sphingobium sp.]